MQSNGPPATFSIYSPTTRRINQRFCCQIKVLSTWFRVSVPKLSLWSPIKEQFIQGLQNESIPTDILAKTSQLKTLEDVIKHSEAFEIAQSDQIQLQGNSEVMAARMSDYQKKKKESNLPKPQIFRPYSGCGSHSHGQPGCHDRCTKCPAWVKNCLNCKIPNHFARVCWQQSQSDSAQALNASVEYDQGSDTFRTTLTSVEEIPAILSTSLPRHQHINPVKMNIFPDSEASICLAGPQHIAKFNLDTHDVLQASKSSWRIQTDMLWMAINNILDWEEHQKATCLHLW